MQRKIPADKDFYKSRHDDKTYYAILCNSSVEKFHIGHSDDVLWFGSGYIHTKFTGGFISILVFNKYKNHLS